MKGIYIASKTKHAPAWRRWRDGCGIKIISSWIDVAEVPDEEKNYPHMWAEFRREITEASALVFYAEPGDLGQIKGAYVEAGMALGFGLPVFVYLKDIEIEVHTWRPIGSWLAHPRVRMCTSILDAFTGAADA